MIRLCYQGSSVSALTATAMALCSAPAGMQSAILPMLWVRMQNSNKLIPACLMGTSALEDLLLLMGWRVLPALQRQQAPETSPGVPTELPGTAWSEPGIVI